MAENSGTLALPRLRDELFLLPGIEDHSGARTWTLYDPLRHAYFQLDHMGFELLAHWALGDASRLIETVRAQSFLRPSLKDVAALIEFLNRNCLVDRTDAKTGEVFAAIKERSRPRWQTWLLHSYLLFRVPLVRPQRLLNAVESWLALFHSPGAPLIFASMAVAGLYLAGRQWETFFATFTAFGTWQGQVALALAVFFSKLLHEFGHAVTLHRLGGRVPTMGVAFLVMFPVLYTDTSDCWRLQTRRARLAVGFGGVKTELALAATALFLWSFVPEGPVKAALFILATTVWAGTLLINLNPLMRFDGYYLLSDWLGVPNLQPRAFALARWRMREFLFGVGLAPPEIFPRAKARTLLVYAYATWAYRLVLFIGIALVVYHFFFKLLGLALFTVEIGWFILRPMRNEIAEWWRLRRSMRWGWAMARTLLLLTGAVFAVLFPWRSDIAAPAVIEAAATIDLYPPMAARVAEITVTSGAEVSRGERLFRLESPELAFKRDIARQELAVDRLRRVQRAVDRQGARDAGVLARAIVRGEAKLKGIEQNLARLEIAAPIDGVLTDVPNGIRAGLWVNESVRLGTVRARKGAMLTGYVEQDNLAMVSPGARIRFVGTDPNAPPVEGVVEQVADLAEERLEEPLLASVHEGPIGVRREADGSLRPETAIYRFSATMESHAASHRIRGTARIEGKAYNVLDRFIRSIAMVLIRESGF